MDNRKDQTKRLIADSFKTLLLARPFDKISIMDIAVQAGIRRPSFYNHFQDKYALLEWIVGEDVIAPAEDALAAGENREALYILIDRMLADAAFYKKAFAVEGQNGFFDSFVLRLQEVLLCCLPENSTAAPSILSARQIAHFHAECFVFAARSWLMSGKSAAAQELTEALLFLGRSSLWEEREAPAAADDRR